MAVQRVLGILEDGSQQGDNLPENARTPLRMIAGTTTTIILTAVRNDGSEIDLTAVGTVVTLYVKKSSLQQSYAALTKVGAHQTAQPTNTVAFSIAPNDTKFVPPGRYVYEIRMVDAESNVSVLVPLSTFVLEPGLNVLY